MTSSDAPSPQAAAPKRGRGRLVALLPLAIFLALAALFTRQLFFGGDASRVPSPLIGKPAPQTDLPALPGMNVPGLNAADLRDGHVTLVNIFASWCIPCRDEADILLRMAADPKLKAEGVRIAGISYKDDPAKARDFLAQGNPYSAIGVDRAGRAAIDWGVYGVPETFVVNGKGTIVYKVIGQITPENLRSTLEPEIAKALRAN